MGITIPRLFQAFLSVTPASPSLLKCSLCVVLALLVHPVSATESVFSLAEARTANVVLQAWDLSCGAAALATVLNFQHGDRVTEKEIATALMSRQVYLDNPELVRFRQGFSLLDMKRFADARGYQGVGLGQMTLDHLEREAPAIVPINAHGYPHFVIFRGVREDRVLLADPAFGNRTLLRSVFEDQWIRYPELGPVAFVVRRKDRLIPPNRLQPRPEEFLTLR